MARFGEHFTMQNQNFPGEKEIYCLQILLVPCSEHSINKLWLTEGKKEMSE